MSKNRSSALKRDREVRKNEKRAMKRQRREIRKLGEPEGIPGDPAVAGLVEGDHSDDSAAGSTGPSQATDVPPQA